MTRLTLLLLTCLPLAAMGSDNYRYLCQQAGEEREIEVAYLLPDQTVPCEVRYRKNNGKPEVLWRANNQEGFCEIKAQELMEKQTQWGFGCEGENLPAQQISRGRY